nr:hypothetical protein [Tanacetum cinerariifolium]
MARQCPKTKRKRDATWFRDKVLLVEAQGSAYQADDLDAYDSDYNDFSTAKAVLLANLSSYRSNVLSEEKELLTKTFNLFKNESKEKEAKNIDKEIALEKKVKELDNIVCKMDFGKRFVPQQELSDKQAFWLQTSHPNTNQSASSPVKIEAPQELPKCENDIDEIETINIELEHKVAKLTAKNDHLKQTYKQLLNLVKPLRKFKEKDIVNNAVQVSNATTIALGIYNLEPITLAHKDKNNRKTHIYYLKHTMEQAAILREIVEQAKSLNPLNSASYSACKYLKLIQESQGYVRDTCPDIHKPSEKLLVVTSINKKKTVRFAEPIISSSTSQK